VMRKIVIGLAAAAIATAASTLSASAIHGGFGGGGGFGRGGFARPAVGGGAFGRSAFARSGRFMGPVPSHSAATDLLSVTPALGVGLPSITAPSGIGLPSIIPSSEIDLPSVGLPSIARSFEGTGFTASLTRTASTARARAVCGLRGDGAYDGYANEREDKRL
jgi:hypothetical protein